MVKKSQIIFMDGKEQALRLLFDYTRENAFGYLAVGFSENNDGFEDPKASSEPIESGFNEITNGSYQRVQLEPYTGGENPERDPDSGKVLMKFAATLQEENISEPTSINQIAIVDSEEIGADTNYYSATTFQTFQKTGNSSITFVVGFKL